MPTKRSRDWSAYYSDSDEDGQVSITATVGQNGAVSYSRHPVVTKEWTHDESSVASDDEAEPAESSLSGKLTKAKPRKHGTAELVAALLEHSDALRDAISVNEREADIGNSCSCNRPAAFAIYRCTECFARGPLCSNCMVTSHQHMPLHWIEKWDGSQFVKDSLSNLRLVISLGHQSRRCPNAIWGPEPGRLMTIIHTNGIHSVRVVCCRCNTPLIPDVIQLAQAGFFPATIQSPRTVFTFQILKDFELHSLAAKKSAQRQFAELQRLTKQASPTAAPNRHASILPVARVWRQLTRRDHDTDGGIQHISLPTLQTEEAALQAN